MQKKDGKGGAVYTCTCDFESRYTVIFHKGERVSLLDESEYQLFDSTDTDVMVKKLAGEEANIPVWLTRAELDECFESRTYKINNLLNE